MIDEFVNPDVLIVGAGPTGLTLACALLQRGVSCRIVDAAQTRSTLSKAVAITPATLEVMRALGVAGELIARGLRLDRAVYFSGAQPILRFHRFARTAFPYMVMLPQRQTEDVLAARLGALGGRVEHGVTLARLEPGPSRVGVELTRADGGAESAAARWLVGCDGPHSTVRRELGIAFEGSRYPDAFVLADARVDGAARDAAHFHLSPRGLFVTIPLPGGVHRLTFDVASDTPELDAEQMQRLIDERTLGRLTLGEMTWKSTFRVHRRLAARYRGGRCVLAGDAAHVHSPAGGQGMNLGIQDAWALAWRLDLLARGLASPSTLDRYAAERRSAARRVLRETHVMTVLGQARHPAVRALRDGCLRAFTTSGMAQRHGAPTLGQLNTRYPRGRPAALAALVRLLARGPLPGDRAPDAALESERGEPVRLSEVVLSARFGTLVAFAGDLDGEREAVLRAVRSAAPLRAVAIVRSAAAAAVLRSAGGAATGEVLVDAGGRAHADWGAGSPTLFVVRPDAHVERRAPLAAQPGPRSDGRANRKSPTR